MTAAEGLRDRFCNGSRTDAASTDPNSLSGTLDVDTDVLDVGIPNPGRHVVGVADLIPEPGSLAANVTSTSHRFSFHNSKERDTVA